MIGLMVGFIMMYYDDGNGIFEYSSYGVFKIMIDKRYQGNGYGKEAMIKAIEFSKTSPHGKARVVELTYKPDNLIAKNLYNSLVICSNEEVGVMDDLVSPSISLLWPEPDSNSSKAALTPFDIADLGVDSIVRTMDTYNRHYNAIRAIVAQLTDDAEVIKYRLDIFDCLLKHEDIRLCFEEVVPLLDGLKHNKTRFNENNSELLGTVWKLKELSLYVDCMNKLGKALDKPDSELNALGVQKLRDAVRQIQSDDKFIHLSTELPNMKAGLESIGSVSIGINFDAQLQPVQATLLSINEKRYKGNTMLGKLFGAPLQQDQGVSALYNDPDVFRETAKLDGQELGLRRALFRDIGKIKKAVVKPVETAILQYLSMNTGQFLSMEHEIAFYLGGLKMIKQLRDSGIPMCRPVVVPREERRCVLKDMSHLILALHAAKETIVANDAVFDELGRIFLVTGPNSGGKSIYAHGIALVHVLLQAGLYVPCQEAIISPVDRIFSHFHVEDNPDQSSGKMGVESKRLQEIFQQATRHSLILLNETFSSTSPGESLYLMKDIVGALRMLGARAVVVTHLHELAASIAQINTEYRGDSDVISLVAGVVGPGDSPLVRTRTYKIQPGPPQGKSYAKDIATQYGISFEQLESLLRERNVVMQ